MKKQEQYNYKSGNKDNEKKNYERQRSNGINV